MDPSQPTPSPPSSGQPLEPLQPVPSAKNRIVQQIESANNVLVTVSNNPTVDQLSAAIGTTLVLNKLGKHATAVFSGEVPSTIDFLQPDKTIEKNTDSLQDFIIALDKSKADKLRYKVEDKFVKIFITPYHTSLSEKDLEFSLGDFNVDVVLALGVKKKEELDQAITAHGRILHDATVISVNHKAGADIGAINWTDPDSSSLSETMVNTCEQLKTDKPLLDRQIATAFLTGIVAETNRFSNEKTMPQTMSTAARLMSAGANQQLISDKLEPAVPVQQEQSTKLPPNPPTAPTQAKPVTQKAKPDSGELLIPHETPNVSLDGRMGDEQDNIDKIHIDDEGQLRRLAELRAREESENNNPEPDDNFDSRKVISAPPSLGSRLTANTEPEPLDPSSDPLSLPTMRQPILDHNSSSISSSPVSQQNSAQTEERTLTDIEKFVNSPHATRQDDGGNTSGFPPQLVPKDQGLSPDRTAGSNSPGPAPPLPPPMVPPRTPDNGTDTSIPL